MAESAEKGKGKRQRKMAPQSRSANRSCVRTVLHHATKPMQAAMAAKWHDAAATTKVCQIAR